MPMPTPSASPTSASNKGRKRQASAIDTDEIIKQAMAKSGQLQPGQTPEQFLKQLGAVLEKDEHTIAVRMIDSVFVLSLEPDMKGATVFIFSLDQNPMNIVEDLNMLGEHMHGLGLNYLIGTDVPPGVQKLVKQTGRKVTQLGPDSIRVDF